MLFQKFTRILIVILFCSSVSFWAQNEPTNRGAAIDNVSSILFETKQKDIRQRHKQFENANGVKLHYKVDEASIDKIGGLSEHLIRLFQSINSPLNTQAKTHYR